MTKKKVNKEEKTNIVENETGKRTDYILAIFLIFLGFVLLLNTTGLIEWNIWSILWRFWPLLVIFAGLSLIFEGSKVLSIIIGFFALVALSLAFLWSAAIVESPQWFDRVVEMETEIEKKIVLSTQNFSNIKRKNIDIDMSVGSLYIANDDLEDHLYLDAKYSNNLGKPVLESESISDTLNVSLELGKGSPTFFWGGKVTPKYFLTLGSDEISTDLSINVGAGQGEVSLQKYNLRYLSMEVGAGKLRSKLSDISLDELNLDVGAGNLSLELVDNIEIAKVINANVGVGKLTLNLPEGAQYKLNGNVGIGSIKTPDKEFSGFGKDVVELKSEGYDFADKKFNIVAEVGIGELIIK